MPPGRFALAQGTITATFEVIPAQKVWEIGCKVPQGGLGMVYFTGASQTKSDVKFGLQWGRLPQYWDELLATLAAD